MPPHAHDRRWIAREEERFEAQRLLAERGYAVLWTPVVGRVVVSSLAEWDAAVVRRTPWPRRAS